MSEYTEGSTACDACGQTTEWFYDCKLDGKIRSLCETCYINLRDIGK